MKQRILLVLMVIVGIFSITGCGKSKNKDLPKLENNSECCNGCMCGDTMELLKNTETAWTLTEINSKGEYVYDRYSFINFHGTGKNKFAFYKNDENGNTISEIRGELVINKQDEITLIPNDNNNEKITCKIGEEKDLIAILYCDNDFGTFTLQKEGTLELPSIIKDTISNTKTIVIKGNQSDYKNKIITEEKEINMLLLVINSSKVWTGPVTLPSPLYEMELFDANYNSIAKIVYNPNHYFDIEINDKDYELTNIDKDSLNAILAN
ncbi:MAG: hypothetical protein IJ565_02625 [Bacilli bacterium]|nr:hypothetical protein [Bacilli bacterium]